MYQTTFVKLRWRVATTLTTSPTHYQTLALPQRRFSTPLPRISRAAVIPSREFLACSSNSFYLRASPHSKERTCQDLQFSYGVIPVHVRKVPASWCSWVNQWAQKNGLPGSFAILTEKVLIADGRGKLYDGDDFHSVKNKKNAPRNSSHGRGSLAVAGPLERVDHRGVSRGNDHRPRVFGAAECSTLPISFG